MKTEVHQEPLDGIYNSNTVASLRVEFERREFALLNLISSLQRELLHTKSLSTNWGDNHITEDNQLRTVIIDPTVNLEIKELKKRIFEKDEIIKKARENIQALNFNPHKNTATGLKNKCRILSAENKNLGHYVVEDKLQPLNILLTNNRKMIDALKIEIKQLRELNNEIDKDNNSLTEQLDKMIKLYSSVKEEKDKLIKENENLQRTINDLQSSETQRTKHSSSVHSKESNRSASLGNGNYSPVRTIKRSRPEKESKMHQDKIRDKFSESKKSRGRSRERGHDRSHKDSHRDSDRYSRRKDRAKSDKYRDRD